MNKKLYLEFQDTVGEKASIVINDPSEDLDESTIMAQMNAIIGANVFNSKGNDLATAEKAYVVEQIKTEYL
jgi:hypothetical protein